MRPRIIPVILMFNGEIYNTKKFKKDRYIGDPINTANLFNAMEVDELVILDVTASRSGNAPNLQLLDKIRSRCFFPVSYGGGIKTLKDAGKILALGVEKVILNSVLFEDLTEYQNIVERYGSQSVSVSLDLKRDFFQRYKVHSHSKRKVSISDPIQWLRKLTATASPGEILLTSVNNDGKSMGYDIVLLKKIVNALPNLPIVINGGAGKLEDFLVAIKSGAHAAAATSLFVYKNDGILINYPTQNQLIEVLG